MKSIPYDASFLGQPVSKPGKESIEGLKFDEVVTVRRIITVSAFLMAFALAALGLSTAQGASLSGWYNSLDTAARQSARTGRPLMAVIARTGCPACASMEQNLAHPQVAKALRGAVKVRLESSQYPAMTSKYASGGTPTTLIFSAGNTSQPVYSYTGVMSDATLKQLGQSLSSMAE